MQNTLSVTLPGGLRDSNVLQRHAEFKPVTGCLEQLIYSSGQALHNLPQRVSEILSHALHSIGNQAVDMTRASSLCVADRQYLMLCLARLMGGDSYWLQGKCKQCHETFDINIKQSELPVQQAGKGYPFVSVDLSGHTLRLRIPTGGDQQTIQDLESHQAVKTLLAECLVAITPKSDPRKFIDKLSDEELENIDAALDRVSPSIGTRIQTNCPECQASQVIQLDPYHLVQRPGGELYQDVHRIACHYHWSEQEIMSLPRTRRLLYLGLIDSSQGMHG
jgi:hypothetical protein